jgi:hypothetical protein
MDSFCNGDNRFCAITWVDFNDLRDAKLDTLFK